MTGSLNTLAILALIVEFLTEAVRENIPYAKRIPGGLLAALIGILLCFLTETGLLYLVLGYSRIVQIDYLITGLCISRGSSLIHDLIGTLKSFTHRLISRRPS